MYVHLSHVDYVHIYTWMPRPRTYLNSPARLLSSTPLKIYTHILEAQPTINPSRKTYPPTNCYTNILHPPHPYTPSTSPSPASNALTANAVTTPLLPILFLVLPNLHTHPISHPPSTSCNSRRYETSLPHHTPTA